MPLYDYRCEACGNEFEQLVKSARSKVTCDCGSSKTARQMPRVALRTTSPNAPTLWTGANDGMPNGCGMIERDDESGCSHCH